MRSTCPNPNHTPYLTPYPCGPGAARALERDASALTLTLPPTPTPRAPQALERAAPAPTLTIPPTQAPRAAGALERAAPAPHLLWPRALPGAAPRPGGLPRLRLGRRAAVRQARARPGLPLRERALRHALAAPGAACILGPARYLFVVKCTFCCACWHCRTGCNPACPPSAQWRVAPIPVPYLIDALCTAARRLWRAPCCRAAGPPRACLTRCAALQAGRVAAEGGRAAPARAKAGRGLGAGARGCSGGRLTCGRLSTNHCKSAC